MLEIEKPKIECVEMSDDAVSYTHLGTAAIVGNGRDVFDQADLLSLIHIFLKLKREEGITVILITHFMEEAILADHVIVMDAGRIVRRGAPRAVFSHVEAVSYTHLRTRPWRSP